MLDYTTIFLNRGAAEDKIESFSAKFGSDVPPENVIELVYQLHEISKSESIPLDQIPDYIKQKLEMTQKNDDQLKTEYLIQKIKSYVGRCLAMLQHYCDADPEVNSLAVASTVYVTVNLSPLNV